MRAKALLRILTVAVIAGLPVVSACEDDPLAAGRGEPAVLDISRKQMIETLGAPFTVTVVIRDAQYNTLIEDLTVTSTAPNIVRVDSVVYVRETGKYIAYFSPNAIEVTGAVKIEFAAGGLRDTTTVLVFPGGMKVDGPPAALKSGETFRLSPVALTKGGEPSGPISTTYKMVSGSADVVVLEKDGDDWLVYAHDPGVVEIEFTGTGEVTARVTIPVEPVEFAGVITPTSGASGDLITITAGADQPEFDADTRVFIGGVPAHVGVTPNTITAMLPYTFAAGSYPVLITRAGAGNVALGGPTVQITSTIDVAPEPPAGPQPLPIYAMGTVGAGDLADDFEFTLTEDATIEFILGWTAGVDLDLEIYDSEDNLVCYSWYDQPEHVTCDLPAGDYYISVFNYTAYAGGSGAPAVYHVSAVKKE